MYLKFTWLHNLAKEHLLWPRESLILRQAESGIERASFSLAGSTCMVFIWSFIDGASCPHRFMLELGRFPTNELFLCAFLWIYIFCFYCQWLFCRSTWVQRGRQEKMQSWVILLQKRTAIWFPWVSCSLGKVFGVIVSAKQQPSTWRFVHVQDTKMPNFPRCLELISAVRPDLVLRSPALGAAFLLL